MLFDKPELGYPIVSTITAANTPFHDTASRFDDLGRPDRSSWPQAFPAQARSPDVPMRFANRQSDMTDSMPNSEAPHRINGATEIGKSTPPAHPQGRPAPLWRVVASNAGQRG